MTLVERPEALRQVEFISTFFELEFQESVDLQAWDLLRLRRDLRQAAALLVSDEDGGRDAFAALFEPPVPLDPLARKRVQRPGPGFVIRGRHLENRQYEAGESLELHVFFWGRAIQHLADFARILASLGGVGLLKGQGLFELALIEAENASGVREPLWLCGDDSEDLTPPLLDAAWWIDGRRPLAVEPLELSFPTPCRLLSGGRPLFKPSFVDIFPFILRRVTSMAQAHCGVELIDDPRPLIAASRQILETGSNLRWMDWRRLEGEDRQQDLGGILGRLRLHGPQLADILWVLQLGSLLQLGKGASFGAGRYDLRPAG